MIGPNDPVIGLFSFLLTQQRSGLRPSISGLIFKKFLHSFFLIKANIYESVLRQKAFTRCFQLLNFYCLRYRTVSGPIKFNLEGLIHKRIILCILALLGHLVIVYLQVDHWVTSVIVLLKVKCLEFIGDHDIWEFGL